MADVLAAFANSGKLLGDLVAGILPVGASVGEGIGVGEGIAGPLAAFPLLCVGFSVPVWTVGFAEEDLLVGEDDTGASVVSFIVGFAVAGATIGLLDGLDVVGFKEGLIVGVPVLGFIEGDDVGLAVVGAMLGL